MRHLGIYTFSTFSISVFYFRNSYIIYLCSKFVDATGLIDIHIVIVNAAAVAADAVPCCFRCLISFSQNLLFDTVGHLLSFCWHVHSERMAIALWDCL